MIVKYRNMPYAKRIDKLFFNNRLCSHREDGAHDVRDFLVNKSSELYYIVDFKHKPKNIERYFESILSALLHESSFIKLKNELDKCFNNILL